jgi:predicted RNase H-related nuclease YkuK (DUF458 family)
MSVRIADILNNALLKDDDILVGITIHLDVGNDGKTATMIRDVVNYVKNCGYDVCFKNASRFNDKKYEYPVAASSVADRYSK